MKHKLFFSVALLVLMGSVYYLWIALKKPIDQPAVSITSLSKKLDNLPECKQPNNDLIPADYTLVDQGGRINPQGEFYQECSFRFQSADNSTLNLTFRQELNDDGGLAGYLNQNPRPSPFDEYAVAKDFVYKNRPGIVRIDRTLNTKQDLLYILTYELAEISLQQAINVYSMQINCSSC